MAGNDNQDPRAGPEVRKASLLVSGLMLTSDADLEAFRKRRAANPDLDPAHLRRARDLLDAVAEAISSPDDARWEAIARAWAALRVEAPAAARGSAPGRAPAAPETTLHSVAAVSGGPREPPRVGTVLGPDQIPEGIEIPHKPSPWLAPVAAMEARAIAQPPPARPSAPPPRASAAPPRASAAPPSHPGASTLNSPYGLRPAPAAPGPAEPPPPPGVDIAALDRIKLDGDNPATLPNEAKLTQSSLPFRGARPAPPPSALEDSYEHDPLNRTTTSLTELPVSKRSLPFEPASEGPSSARSPATGFPASAEHQPPAHLHGMTLEQYAALCAECSVNPAWMEAIQQRYGIRSTDERAALDRHWRSRIVSDDELSRLYRWHFSRYQEWARTRR